MFNISVVKFKFIDNVHTKALYFLKHL